MADIARLVIKVDADTTAAANNLKELEARLARLEGKTVKIDIDAQTAGAIAHIDELEARLAAMSANHHNVNIDTNSAVSNIENLTGSMASSGSRMGMWVGAIALLSPAVLALTGAIGGIAAMATVSGLALGAFGLAVAGNAALQPALNNFTAAWRAWQAQMAATVTVPVTAWLKALSGHLDALNPIVNVTSDVLTRGAKAFDTFLSSNQMKSWMADMTNATKTILPNLGGAFGNVFVGIMEIIRAFLPLATDMSKGFENWSVNFRKWAETLDQNKGFQDFVAYVKENGPKLLDIFAQIFGGLWKLIQALAPFAGAVLAAAGAVGQFLIDADPQKLEAIVTAFLALVAAIKALSIISSVITMFAAFLNPVGLVVLAIAALAAGFVYLYQTSEPFRAWVQDKLVPALRQLWGDIKDLIVPIIQDVLIPLWNKVVDAATAIWSAIQTHILPALLSLWSNIQEGVNNMHPFLELLGKIAGGFIELAKTILIEIVIPALGLLIRALGEVISWITKVIGVFGEIVSYIIDHFMPTVSAIGEAFVTAFTFIRDRVVDFWNFLVDTFTNQLNNIKATWDNIWGAIKQIALDIWGALQTAWETFINTLKTIWDNVSGALSTAWSATWNALKAAGQAVWDAIRTAWDAVVNALISTWNTVSGALSAAWSSVWNAMKATGQAIWDAIRTAWDAAVNALKAVWDTVSGALHTAWDSVWNAMKATGQAIWDAIRTAWEAVVNAMKAVWDSVSSALHTAWDSVWNAMKASGQAVWDAIKTAWEAVVNAMKAVWDSVSAALHTAWDSVWNAMKASGQAIWDAMKAAWDTIVNAIKSIWDTVSSALSSAWSTVWNTIHTVATGIWDKIKVAWDTMINALKTLWDTVSGTIKSIWEGTWNTIHDVAKGVWDKIQGAWNTFSDTLKSGIQGTIDTVKKIWDGLVDVFKAPVKLVLDVWNGVAKPLGLPTVDTSNFAEGGPVNGKGGNRDDKIPAMLSNGEHVWTAKEVQAMGGHSRVAGLRQEALRGYADGGPVGNGSVILPDPNAQAVSVNSNIPKKDDSILGKIGNAVSSAAGAVADTAKGIASAALTGAGNPIADKVKDVAATVAYDVAKPLVDAIVSGVPDPIPGTRKDAGSVPHAGIAKVAEAALGIFKKGQDEAKAAAAAATAAGSGGAGVAGSIPEGDHLSIIHQAMGFAGVPPPGTQQDWEIGLNTLITRESGWNPGAVNLTDSNATAGHPSQGLAQTIPSTFAAYHVPGTSDSITDAVANVAAAIRYIVATYGSITNVQQANANLPPAGYWGGTTSAQRGWARVGERGPEWLQMGGGERILPNGQYPYSDAVGGGGSVQVHEGAVKVIIQGNVTPETVPQIVNGFNEGLRQALVARKGRK